MLPKSILIVPLLCSSLACASVEFGKIANDEADKKATGIRYLETSPYLLLHSNPDGSLAVRLEYLPDPHKKMAVEPKTLAAKVEATLEFDRGVLTSADTTADAAVVPKAILKAAETVLPALAAFLNDARSAEGKTGAISVPAPYLYKVIVRGSDVFFIGGPGDKAFQVTLLPAKEKKEKAS